jgi:hypothetical protein
VGDSNTPLSSINKSFTQKTKNDNSELSATIDSMDLIYIYKILHPIVTEYIFLSEAHKTFSKIGHILGHKSSLKNTRKLK